MPAFLEKRLKAEYGQNSDIPFKVANSLQLMRGARETAKGRALDRKHTRDVAAGKAKK